MHLENFLLDTCYSKHELHQLFLRAVDARTTRAYDEVQWFYRDKSPAYFDEIMQSSSKRVMKTYMKDRNGDPRSPINGRLCGLHFSVNVHQKTGLPIKPSVFGSMRLMIPAWVMFDICPKLYFTDFYCINKQIHHVTLVMTKEGSSADSFCAQHLISLDPRHNPFLRCPKNPLEAASIAQGNIWVEVLFTNDIDMDLVMLLGGNLDEVRWRGNKRNGPRAKDPNCDVCNIP